MPRSAPALTVLLLMALPAPAALAQQGADGASPTPRLDYQPVGNRDDTVTSGMASTPGRWVGTWRGTDGSSFTGAYEGGVHTPAAQQPPATPAPTPKNPPNPAYIGSGAVVDGWYYPPPMTTTTTTTYEAKRPAPKR